MCTCSFCTNPATESQPVIKRLACIICGVAHIPKKSQKDGEHGFLCTRCFVASTPCPECTRRYVGVPGCGCIVKCTIGSHFVKKTALVAKGICQDCLEVPETDKNSLVAMIGQEAIPAGRAAAADKIVPSDVDQNGIAHEKLVSCNVRDYMVRNIARALDIQGPDALYLYGITDDHEVDLLVCDCCNTELRARGYNSHANGLVNNTTHRVGISRALRLDDHRRDRLTQDLNAVFKTRQALRPPPRRRAQAVRQVNIAIDADPILPPLILPPLR